MAIERAESLETWEVPAVVISSEKKLDAGCAAGAKGKKNGKKKVGHFAKSLAKKKKTVDLAKKTAAGLAADPEASAHLALVKAADSGKDAIPENFRKNQLGRKLIRQQMEALILLDLTLWPQNPVWDESTGELKMKNLPEGKGITAKEIINRSPAFMETFFWKTKSPMEYGKSVYSLFQKARKDLQNAKSRQPFLRLLADICKATLPSL